MELHVLILCGLILILVHPSFLQGQDIVFPDKTRPPPPPRFQRPRPTGLSPWPRPLTPTTLRTMTMTPTPTAWVPPPPSTRTPPPPQVAFPSTSKQTTKCERHCVVLDLCPALYKLLDSPTRQNLRLLKESSCGFTSTGDPLVWCDEFVCDPVKKRGSGVLAPAALLYAQPVPLTLRPDPQDSYFSDRNSNRNSNSNTGNTWTMTPFVSTRSALPVPFAAPDPAPFPSPKIAEISSGKEVQNIFGSTTATGAMNLALSTLASAPPPPQKSSFRFPNDRPAQVPSLSPSAPLNSGADSLNSADCGIAFPSRISGGSNAGKGEFPWIVALSVHSKNGPQVICGGALISSTWVLTAAHCVADSAHNLRNVSSVRVGAHNISNLSEEGAEVVGVRRIVLHSEFRERPLVKNDIALLQLDRSLVSSNVIGPICLPMGAAVSDQSDVDSLYTPGSSATIAGWGSDGTKPSYSILQKVDVPIVDGEICRREFYRVRVRVVPDIQICAGEPHKDSCKGDSGGPLMRDVNGRTTLIGIISFGTSQCDGRLPGVYTKITSYSQWITENVRKYS